MDVQITPELEAKLDRLSRETRRKVGELIEAALAGYIDEMLELRQTLDRRYDDVTSGRVKLVPAKVAIARLRAKRLSLHPLGE